MTRLVLLLAVVALAQAQTAAPGVSPEAQYHTGARAFIDGDHARALAAVDAGLAAAPDDARLQALRELIEQQQDEQDNQDGGQQDPQADNQDQGDQGEGDQGEDGDQQTPPDEPDGPEAEADQTGTPPPSDPQAGDTPPPPAPGEPDEMTAAQAERILDAVGGEERLLLREIRRAPAQRRRSDKDW